MLAIRLFSFSNSPPFLRRFFVTHCEYVVAKRKRPRSLRSRSSFMQSISAPIASFKQRQPAERQDKPPQQDVGKSPPTSPSGPQFNFIGPTPLTTLEAIEEQPQELSGDTLTDLYKEKHDAIISDGPLSSSPKSDNLVLSPVSEPYLRSPPVVEFAPTTTISPRVPNNNPMLILRGQFSSSLWSFSRQ